MSSEHEIASSKEDPASNNLSSLQQVLEQAAAAHQAGDDVSANALYRHAARVDPTSLAAWMGCAATAGDPIEAIQSWSAAGALDPLNEVCAAGLAEAIHRQLASPVANSAPSLVALAKTVAKDGHKASAYLLARRATELDPQDDDAWVWRGGLSDDNEEMARCLKQALALNPENTQALTGLEWSELKPRNYGPDNSPLAEKSRIALEQGQQALKGGDKAQAQLLFKEATDLDRRNEHAWLWRASTTANLDEALSYIEQALAVNPNNQPAQNARTWLRVKKLRDASHDPSQVPPARSSLDVTTIRSRGRNRAARIIPLSFLVLALLILVLALLFQRGF